MNVIAAAASLREAAIRSAARRTARRTLAGIVRRGYTVEDVRAALAIVDCKHEGTEAGDRFCETCGKELPPRPPCHCRRCSETYEAGIRYGEARR